MVAISVAAIIPGVIISVVSVIVIVPWIPVWTSKREAEIQARSVIVGIVVMGTVKVRVIEMIASVVRISI